MNYFLANMTILLTSLFLAACSSTRDLRRCIDVKVPSPSAYDECPQR